MICEHCGDAWDDQLATHWNLDVRTSPSRGVRFAQWFPCCEANRDEVDAFGFEAVHGRTVEDVCSEILGLEVLAVEGDGDGSVVGRLVIHDPTVVNANGRASSPKGWQVDVFAAVAEHHRHHEAPTGHKFSVAVYNGGIRVGVAVVGRPVARQLAKLEPRTLEITRVCTWGDAPLRRNAASKLYAAACDRARELGADKVITYTLDGVESGASVRAAGFAEEHVTRGESWDRPGRRRTDKAPTGRKVRWARRLRSGQKGMSSSPPKPPKPPRPCADAGTPP